MTMALFRRSQTIPDQADLCRSSLLDKFGSQFYGICLQQSDVNEKQTVLELTSLPGIPAPPNFEFMSSSFSSSSDSSSSLSSSSLSFLANGWRMTGKLDGWGGKMRLRNPKNKLIATVEERKVRGGYVILSPSPKYHGQQPYRERGQTQRQKSHLYLWATVKSKKSIRGHHWSIRCHESNTKYIANTNGPSLFGRPNVLRILDDRSGAKCAFAQQEDTSSQWNLMIGSTVSPCLMVCIISIIKGGVVKKHRSL